MDLDQLPEEGREAMLNFVRALARRQARLDTALSPGKPMKETMTNLRDIFDRPFAGPEMRRKYEAALGKFLVTFNATENYVRFTVEEICKSLGQIELWEKHLAADDFTKQLKNLRLLVLAEPYFSDTPFERLTALNATRNKFAHGHYDQDLFSDEFEIVGKRKRVKMTVDEIIEATEEADDLWTELGSNLAHFWEREHER